MDALPMAERFVSEPIEPVADSIDTTGMSRGEPGLPREFRWRGQVLHIDRIVESWKERSAKFGEGEKYTRKHWYRLSTADGTLITVYFERQARSRGRTRWWLYSTDTPD